MSPNVKYYNQVNDAVDKELKFDISPILGGSPLKESQQILTIKLIGVKISRNIFLLIIACM